MRFASVLEHVVNVAIEGQDLQRPGNVLLRICCEKKSTLVVEAGYATVLARAMTFSRVWFDRSAHRSMIWDLGFRAKLGLRIYGYSLRS